MRLRTTPSLTIAMMALEDIGVSARCDEISGLCKRIIGALRARDFPLALRRAKDALQVESGSAEALFFRAQIRALLSKLEDLDGFDPLATALTRWRTAEWRCKWVNRRIEAWLRRPADDRPFLAAINRMQEFILSVIGHEPPIGRILRECKFGPGTSVQNGGDATHFFSKLKGCWGVSHTALPYATAAASQLQSVHEMLGTAREGMLCIDPDSFGSKFRDACVIEDLHDIVLAVNKTAETHRMIGQPKLWDGFLQLGVGQVLADMLNKVGIDLRDQRRNQRLAREGSDLETFVPGLGTYSTIDLAMASDTLSKAVVKLLLPPAWYRLVNSLRSPTYRLRDCEDEGVLVYEKFSAMGNGYTFPLETLIFAAVCHASADEGLSSEHFSVYGDDIAIRSGYALRAVELLNFLGFKTNGDKTFIFGNFKESCGEDYVSGVNIRPAYVKGRVMGPLELIGFHNRLLTSGFMALTQLASCIRSLRRDIPVKPFHPTNRGGAFMVPFFDFLATSPPWDSNYGRHVWYELLSHSVIDEDGPLGLPPGALVDGALLGAESRDGTPCFAFRRRVKLRKLRVGTPPDPFFVGPPKRPSRE